MGQQKQKKIQTLGITGSMGSGKSAVRQILAQYIPTIDCDGINRELLKKDHEGWSALKQADLFYGDGNGEINKQAMADAMFEDAKIRQKMEAILQPLIIQKMDEWMAQQENLCAVEVPLLFECGLQDHFDQVWTVICEDQIALERLKQGRNIDPLEAKRRLALQYSPQKKAQQSDVVLHNDQDLHALQTQIEQYLQQLQENADESLKTNR